MSLLSLSESHYVNIQIYVIESCVTKNITF